MTIAEVLHAAIAGGYHIDGSDGVATEYGGANSEYSVWTRTDNHSSFMIPLHETWLDPAFWRALGRALGWDTPCALAITCGSGQEARRRGDGAYWMYQWHCFIQHLADGAPQCCGDILDPQSWGMIAPPHSWWGSFFRTGRRGA
jgi:hypothetical protein